MGCAFSSKVKPTVLQSPDGYDPNKFKLILRLFDRLDSDGNYGVCLEELTDIANLHVENRIRQVLQQKDFTHQRTEFDLQRIGVEERAGVEDVKEKYTALRQAANKKCARAVEKVDAELKRLNELNGAGRSAEFVKALKPKGENIDFWTFFDYMKTRTQDIKNVSFRAAE